MLKGKVKLEAPGQYGDFLYELLSSCDDSSNSDFYLTIN